MPASVLRFGLGLFLVAVLSACSSTGRSFDGQALSQLTIGESSFDDAVALLGPPDTIYPQSNGGQLAFWQYGRSLLTDAIYYRQSLLLSFDARGLFKQVEDKKNIFAQARKAKPKSTVAVHQHVATASNAKPSSLDSSNKARSNSSELSRNTETGSLVSSTNPRPISPDSSSNTQPASLGNSSDTATLRPRTFSEGIVMETVNVRYPIWTPKPVAADPLPQSPK